MDPEEIIIDGKKFRLVKRSRRGEVSVYKSGELFARVGERGVVENMLALHQKFDGFGFPVPTIMGRGETAHGAYFLEESLGEKCFSFLFKDDVEKQGAISDALFEQFLKVTEKFARAQLRSAVSDSPFEKGSTAFRGVEGFNNPHLADSAPPFLRGINPPSSPTRTPPFPPEADPSFGGRKEELSDTLSLADLVRPQDLAEELPEFGEKILERFDEAVAALKAFPFVLTQGDFNPHNLFPRGVIDFEQIYYAPAGYDAVTNIFHINWFPESHDYEYYRLYSFTPGQETLYYTRLDVLYAEAGLPAFSQYRKHFEYCRAIWSAARNERMPKLQAWRYELFKKRYLL